MKSKIPKIGQTIYINNQNGGDIITNEFLQINCNFVKAGLIVDIYQKENIAHIMPFLTGIIYKIPLDLIN